MPQNDPHTVKPLEFPCIQPVAGGIKVAGHFRSIPMRFALTVLITCLAATFAWGQLGLEGQSARDPNLVRALDAASAAFLNAQRDAASGQMIPFRESLGRANERW